MRQWIDILNEARGPVMPLATYIAKNGGLELDGDTRAADFHKLYVPGAGPLARKSGKSIDGFWREKLIAAGYLPDDPDGYAKRDIHRELFDKLHDEQRARLFGTHTNTDDGEAENDGEQAAFQQVENEILAAVREVGMGRADPGVVHRAAMLMWTHKCSDPVDAYEQAAMADEYHAHMAMDDEPAHREPTVHHLPPDDDVPF